MINIIIAFIFAIIIILPSFPVTGAPLSGVALVSLPLALVLAIWSEMLPQLSMDGIADSLAAAAGSLVRSYKDTLDSRVFSLKLVCQWPCDY